MKISLEKLTGEAFTLEVEPSDIIALVIARIQHKEGLVINNTRRWL